MPAFTLRKIVYRKRLQESDGTTLAILLFDDKDKAIAVVARQNLQGAKGGLRKDDIDVVAGICQELSAVAHDALALDTYYQSKLRDASMTIAMDHGHTLDAPTLQDAVKQLNKMLV